MASDEKLKRDNPKKYQEVMAKRAQANAVAQGQYQQAQAQERARHKAETQHYAQAQAARPQTHATTASTQRPLSRPSATPRPKSSSGSSSHFPVSHAVGFTPKAVVPRSYTSLAVPRPTMAGQQPLATLTAPENTPASTKTPIVVAPHHNNTIVPAEQPTAARLTSDSVAHPGPLATASEEPLSTPIISHLPSAASASEATSTPATEASSHSPGVAKPHTLPTLQNSVGKSTTHPASITSGSSPRKFKPSSSSGNETGPNQTNKVRPQHNVSFSDISSFIPDSNTNREALKQVPAGNDNEASSPTKSGSSSPTRSSKGFLRSSFDKLTSAFSSTLNANLTSVTDGEQDVRGNEQKTNTVG
jgi:hypothetical protein